LYNIINNKNKGVVKMKTPSQKRARDEFARIAGNNRVILTSNWIIGRGRFSTVRRLPAGTKKIDYRYFYIANKTLRTKVSSSKRNILIVILLSLSKI
jgi:ribosomal protein L32E